MQLNITISESDSPVVIKRAIAALEGFAGLQNIEVKMDMGAVERLTKLSNTEIANYFGVPTDPLAQPAVSAPSTAAVVPSPTAPVVPQDSSPEPSVPPAPALPTVPAATAPTAPAAPMSHASGVAIDKAGLPWDARIHSSSKALNADGTWRKRKGINDEGLVKRIESELLAAMAVPAASLTLPNVTSSEQAHAQAMAHLPAGVEIDGLHQGGPFPGEGAAPLVMPTPPLPPSTPAIPAPLPGLAAAPTELPNAPVAAIPTAPPTTLAELMPRITGAMMTGALPGTALLDVVKAPPFGIPDLPTLAHRPDLIPQVWSVLQQTYPGVLV